MNHPMDSTYIERLLEAARIRSAQRWDEAHQRVLDSYEKYGKGMSLESYDKWARDIVALTIGPRP